MEDYAHSLKMELYSTSTFHLDVKLSVENFITIERTLSVLAAFGGLISPWYKLLIIMMLEYTPTEDECWHVLY